MIPAWAKPKYLSRMCPTSLCPPQTSHRMAWHQTQAIVANSWQLLAEAQCSPLHLVWSYCVPVPMHMRLHPSYHIPVRSSFHKNQTNYVPTLISSIHIKSVVPAQTNVAGLSCHHTHNFKKSVTEHVHRLTLKVHIDTDVLDNIGCFNSYTALSCRPPVTIFLLGDL